MDSWLQDLNLIQFYFTKGHETDLWDRRQIVPIVLKVFSIRRNC